MYLMCLTTGSCGNCYLLEKDGEILILDCGISFKEVKKALKFDLSKIVGCFISHGHKDHNCYATEFENAGIEIFDPYKTNPIRANKQMKDYYLQAFQLPHNDTVNYGLLGRIKDETFLYCTDMEYCRYVFKGCKVNHFITECNYQEKYISTDLPNFEHKVKGHCELQTCKRFLQSNLSEYMKNVLIIHMGIGSCDPYECCEEIQAVVGDTVKVDYARANQIYRLGV